VRTSVLLVAAGVACAGDAGAPAPFPAEYRKWAVARSLVVGPESKSFAVAVNYGTFERQNAAALSSYFRLSDHVVLSGGVSYGVEQKQFGGRAGMLFAW